MSKLSTYHKRRRRLKTDKRKPFVSDLSKHEINSIEISHSADVIIMDVEIIERKAFPAEFNFAGAFVPFRS